MRLNDRQLTRIRQAERLITRDLSKHYTIEEVAIKVRLNSFTLKKAFKEHYKMGLFAYLKEKRFEKARKIMRYSNKKIYEVAAMVGYAEVSSFITAFKKKFNQSPTEWRSTCYLEDI